MSEESRKVFSVKQIFSEEIVHKKFISKTHFYRWGILLILIGLIGGFVIRSFMIDNPLEDNGSFLGFESTESEFLTFELKIDVIEQPLDIYFEINNLQTSKDVNYSAFMIENITNWIEITLSTNNSSQFTISHELYYDLLQNGNNTLMVKITNKANLSLIKIATFTVKIIKIE